ncbi:MAG: transcription antitermination factor NusB [Clostridia bacterium]|nr:transcription antitermination factor NusB [Clostridia bacterium]
MSRKTAREDAFKLIFSSSLNKEECADILDTFFEEKNRDGEAFAKADKGDAEYIRATLEGVSSHKEEIESKISENLKGWKLERLSRVSVAVLKLAVYEMLYSEDVPASVAINEAVKIAQKYEDEKAGSFVNGVLGSIEKKR